MYERKTLSARGRDAVQICEGDQFMMPVGRRCILKELKFYDREYFRSLVDDKYVPRSTPDYDYEELVKDVIKELYLSVVLFSVRDVVRFIMKFTKGAANPIVLETLVCHELRYDRNK